MTEERLDQILKGIKKCKIAVLGDLMLDRYFWGSVDRISPEAPVPIVSLKGESSNLGGASNVAANVGALGAQVHLLGVVGDDDLGKLLRDHIVKSGFNDEGIIVDPSRPTSVKTRVIAQNQHVVRIDREATHCLDRSIMTKMLVRLRTLLGGVDAVIIEDYNKGMLCPTFIREIIESCTDANVPVGVDPKQENFWSYVGATLFKPNLKEIQSALGRTLTEDNDVIEAGKEIIQRLKLSHLLITRGEQGMTLISDNRAELIPTRARKVHDVSGAGDTVIAVVMTALAGGADISEAAWLANYSASVVIAEVGAVPVDVDDLRRSCLAGG